MFVSIVHAQLIYAFYFWALNYSSYVGQDKEVMMKDVTYREPRRAGFRG